MSTIALNCDLIDEDTQGSENEVVTKSCSDTLSPSEEYAPGISQSCPLGA